MRIIFNPIGFPIPFLKHNEIVPRITKQDTQEPKDMFVKEEEREKYYAMQR